MVKALSADDLYREEVLEARALPAGRKLAMGLELFDRVRQIMMDGIRSENPDADESEVRRMLAQRLELARRLENTP